ncbi:hypothetical protein LZ31DRAFT_485178, partial [Colletotrichum somersetense]
MKSFALLIAFSIISTVSGNGLYRRGVDCKGPGNNCQRGVGGTAGLKPPLSSRLADCSILNSVTVIPSPMTDIVTETVTSAAIIIPTFFAGVNRSIETEATPGGGAVTVTPSSVPMYATYCPDAANYFSACSCAGITPVTTTAPTPTVT